MAAVKKARLDELLVARGLADTRSQAKALILAGKLKIPRSRVTFSSTELGQCFAGRRWSSPTQSSLRSSRSWSKSKQVPPRTASLYCSDVVAAWDPPRGATVSAVFGTVWG